jgi:Ran GTPase-activating protein (RanGAP) involved in mRNA processing and transport
VIPYEEDKEEITTLHKTKSQPVIKSSSAKGRIDSFQYKFKLEGPRVLVMAAHTQEEAKEWVKILQNSINVTNYVDACERLDSIPLLSSLKTLSDEKEEILSIENEKITLEGAKALSNFVISYNKTIKKLKINNCNLVDEHLQLISKAIGNNEMIDSIDFSFNKISNYGVSDLLDSIYINVNITNLNLSHNQISDVGAIYISDFLKTNISITHLDLSFNDFTQTGIEQISKGIIDNQTMTSLNLSHNNIGEKGINFLSESLKQNKNVI